MPHRRILLMGMLAANLCLPFALITSQEQVQQVALTPSQATAEIHLLDEIAAAPVQELLAPVSECRIWGPELEAGAFDGIIAQLDRQGSDPDVQKTELPIAPDYLVYIGDLETKASANRARKKLNDQRIDSYVIKRENAAPILSVGVFSREEYAKTQLQTVEKLGYKGFIEELPKSQTVYNLTAHVSIASELYKSSSSGCMTFAHNL